MSALTITTEHYFTAQHGIDGATAANQYAGRYNADEVSDAIDNDQMSNLTMCVITLSNGHPFVGSTTDTENPLKSAYTAAVKVALATYKDELLLYPSIDKQWIIGEGQVLVFEGYDTK